MMATPAENSERHAWVSAGLAITQISAGTWLVVLLLIGGPKWLLIAFGNCSASPSVPSASLVAIAALR
jgi:hypothetical protein